MQQQQPVYGQPVPAYGQQAPMQQQSDFGQSVPSYGQQPQYGQLSASAYGHQQQQQYYQ